MILQASGTLNAIVGTEITLNGSGFTTPFATWINFVDLSNMQAADQVELRVYTQVLSSSSLVCVNYTLFAGVPNVTGGQIAVSLPIVSDLQISFTLKQTAGTARAFPWKIITL